jgi:flagellar biosynthesis GTPase FlhF
VPAAIEKAAKDAQSNMTRIETIGDTIGHEVRGEHGSASVLLMPASPGTGVKAGGTVRSIMQVAGVHNVLTKVYGPTNPINVAKATMKALKSIRSKSEVEKLRGVEIEINHPQVKTGKAKKEETEESAEEAAGSEEQTEQTPEAQAKTAETEEAAAEETEAEDTGEEAPEATAESEETAETEEAEEAETVEVAAETETETEEDEQEED